MSKIFSLRSFGLVFALAYAAALIFKLPLFRYYPLLKEFSLSDIGGGNTGPAMTWYGWMATALIAAIIGGFVIPRSLNEKIPGAVYWLIPIIIFASGFYTEKTWFLSP